MISIVICSIREFYFVSLERNIKETIGNLDYEIIKIDNLKEKLSITKAYNIGIEKSQFEYLLFIHEDLSFHTKNWGNILKELFEENPEVGLLGIAGAKYKSKFPSAFWHTNEEMLNVNLIQHRPGKKPGLLQYGFQQKNIEPVVVIDGVFLALRKNTKVKFNECIEGFHCYDLGISIDVIENNFKIAITNQILIEHFSSGNTDLNFVKNVIKFHKLYNKKLPKYISKKDFNLENVALKKFLSVCLSNKFVPFNLWFYNLLYNPFARLNYNILKLVIYKLRRK